MAGGDLALVLCSAVVVGVAIGLGYRVRQLEAEVAMLQPACAGKDETILALVRENETLKDLVFGELVETRDLWPRHEIITVVPHSEKTLH